MKNISSSARLEAALARIDDPKGEGARACLTIYRHAARAAAEAADARARAGISFGPLDGAVVSIKDLFDVAGEVTRAGSKLLAEEGSPALSDAPVVQRLRAAGAIIIAKTNMTEFAFSGIGANPHYGTPGNPADRTRAPGGSSSGAAVAVADAMCDISIGTDTGGSTRVPAAFCGVIGFKPSRRRIPTTGAFPLSFTLDSIGPLTKSVAECAKADAIMAGESVVNFDPAPLLGLRIGIVQNAMLMDACDATVAKGFYAAIERLKKAGVHFSDEKLPLIERMDAVNANGAIAPTEAFAIHRDRLARRGDIIDKNVRLRIERASKVSAADYIDTLHARGELVEAMDAKMGDVDVLAMPTTPVVAPRLSDLEDGEAFVRQNALILRNTMIWNFFDCCAISLPLPRDGGLPVGLMLAARNGHDHRLFRIAAAVEKLLAA